MANNNKIKVIHIAQSAGGVAEYIKDLLRYLDKEKYENILIVSNDYVNQNEINENCKKVFFVDMIREIALKKDILAILKIRKIIKQEKPDILYLHSSKAGALGRIATLFCRKIKIVYNAHGWYFNAEISHSKKKIFKWIERVLAFKTNKIVAISKSEYDSAVINQICNKDKITLIENGIDIKKYSDYFKYREDIRNKYKIKKNDIVIGVVGRISEQKDPITSINAACKIIKENKNVYFMFVGTGDLEEKVIRTAKENQIDSNIIITGWVNDVKKYISTFDIALLPSKWEGFGLAILEYMVCKKPIIATNIGGIANILQTNRAFFIEKENANDIVKQYKNIISNPKINSIVEENYKECINKYSIERVALQTENIFEEVLKK